MKKKSTLIKGFLLLFLLGCQTTKPDWVNLPPTNRDYFIGVGNSNLRNKNMDFEMAQEKARFDLAKSIGVMVSGTSEISTYDEEGYSTQSLWERIDESVSQHLELVEIVDSWYSRKEGWWFLMRISKADWFRLLENRQKELETQILELVENKANPIQYLENILIAWDTKMKSPYGANLRISDKEVGLINGDVFLRNVLKNALSQLTFSLTLTQSNLISGQFLEISCKTANSTGKPFILPLIIKNSEGDSLFSVIVSFSSSGRATFLVPTSKFSSGFNDLQIFYDSGDRLISSEELLLLDSFQISVDPVKINLTVQTGGNSDYTFPAIQSLVEKTLPISKNQTYDSKLGNLVFQFDFSEESRSHNKSPYYASVIFTLYYLHPNSSKKEIIYSANIPKQAGPSLLFVCEKIEKRVLGLMESDFIESDRALNTFLKNLETYYD